MTTPTEELDRDCFAKKLRCILRDMDDYTPDELSRELGRLSETASPAFREECEKLALTEANKKLAELQALAYMHEPAGPHDTGITWKQEAIEAQARSKELADMLEIVLRHFTKAPSTLADTTVRGAAHKILLSKSQTEALDKVVREAIVATYNDADEICERELDTANSTGVERDVYIWNRAIEYCRTKLAIAANEQKPYGG